MSNVFSDISEGLGITNPNRAPALNSADVVKDPATGLYVNKRTGVVSTDPSGLNSLVNPTLAQQAARNIAVSNQLLNKLGSVQGQYDQAFQGQTGLVNDLDSVIAGRGTSVAQAGLQQNTGDIIRQQQSQASGATGQNAALARMQAMQNTAMAQAKANQDASLLRAGEIAAAREQKGNVLAQQANQSQGMYGANLNGGLTASGQAGSVESAERQIGSGEDQSRKKLAVNILQGIGSAVASGATGKPPGTP